MKAKINFDGTILPSVELVIHSYTLNERFKRSLKMFLLLFFSSIACILIPVLHFVLVPLFLILSLVMPFRKFKESKSIDLKSLNCPGCNASLNAGVVSLKSDDSTVRLGCNSCRKSLTIILEDMTNDIA